MLAAKLVGRQAAQMLQRAAVCVADEAAVEVFVDIRRPIRRRAHERPRPRLERPGSDIPRATIGVTQRLRDVDAPLRGTRVVERAQVADHDR